MNYKNSWCLLMFQAKNNKNKTYNLHEKLPVKILQKMLDFCSDINSYTLSL